MLSRLTLERNVGYIDTMTIRTLVMLIATWFAHLWLISSKKYSRLISNTWVRIIVSIVLVSFGVYCLLEVLSLIFDMPEINTRFLRLERRLEIRNFIKISLWSIIYQWILFAQKTIEERNNEKLEASKAKQYVLETKISSLREQLNPHFMFNSLSTLSSIAADKTAVKNFVEKLAEVYRYILTIKERKTVTVEEELNFTKAYWYILKERFEEAIELKVELLSDTSKLQIPPMALQNLVDNAIKHNKATKREPLIVTIEERDDSIVVSNKINYKTSESEYLGVGLANLSEQYKLLFHKEMEIFQTDRFTVKLPIVKL